jgi:hypothetical protein
VEVAVHREEELAAEKEVEVAVHGEERPAAENEVEVDVHREERLAAEREVEVVVHRDEELAAAEKEVKHGTLVSTFAAGTPTTVMDPQLDFPTCSSLKVIVRESSCILLFRPARDTVSCDLANTHENIN